MHIVGECTPIYCGRFPLAREMLSGFTIGFTDSQRARRNCIYRPPSQIKSRSLPTSLIARNKHARSISARSRPTLRRRGSPSCACCAAAWPGTASITWRSPHRRTTMRCAGNGASLSPLGCIPARRPPAGRWRESSTSSPATQIEPG